jgi:hypothetical protein
MLRHHPLALQDRGVFLHAPAPRGDLDEYVFCVSIKYMIGQNAG